MHFNAFWHINTHHTILTSTEIKAYIFFPPTFLKFMHENRPPPYFAKEAGCVLVYMEWTPLVLA